MSSAIDPTPSANQGSRRRVRPWAGILAIVYALCGLVGVVPAILSVFLFDAPGSEKRQILWILMGALFALPVVFLCAALVLALAYWKSWRRAAIVAFAAPLAHLVVIIGLFTAV